jgi:hypothetical protein
MIFTNAAGFLYLFKQISDNKNNKSSKLKKPKNDRIRTAI